ncbi:hypothetical protein [Halovenus halobia]|uniref:hypothetical protein n=1 Tax=Halovenus halobia TaxID=3396622 RepID=UPI003F542971
MLPLSPFEFLLLLAALFFSTGFAAAIYFSSEETPTRPHSLILLSLFMRLLTVIGAGAIHLNAEKIDYTVDQSTCTSSENDFSELSPEAQTVFRSTLQADGEFTTRKHPDEFDLWPQTDAVDEGVTNDIQYESACYALRGDSWRGAGTEVMMSVVTGVGSILAIVFGFASAASYGECRRQDLSQRRSTEGTEARTCPNCGLTLAMGVEQCQRCGWSRTDNETEDTDSS